MCLGLGLALGLVLRFGVKVRLEVMVKVRMIFNRVRYIVKKKEEIMTS